MNRNGFLIINREDGLRGAAGGEREGDGPSGTWRGGGGGCDGLCRHRLDECEHGTGGAPPTRRSDRAPHARGSLRGLAGASVDRVAGPGWRAQQIPQLIAYTLPSPPPAVALEHF